MAGSRFKILSKGLNRKRGSMNKAEAAYAAWLVTDADVAGYWFEPFSLRLTRPPAGQPATYTPDFLVLMKDGTTFVDDVKSPRGFDDNAAIVRLKCAAEMYQLWRFRRIKALPANQGGGFHREEV